MANFLTIFRVILAFVTLGLLFSNQPSLYISAVILTILVIAIDGLDGYVARALHEESKLGSVLDILGDRIVENAYWVVFAVLGWVGAWVPILVLSRGLITDTIRSLAFAEGYTAFGENTMMKNKIGHFLTASRFSRGAYGAAKTLAFVLMIAAQIPDIYRYNPMTVRQFVWYTDIQPTLLLIANIFVYIAVIFCVVRGLPVLLDGKRFFVKNDK